MEHQLSEPTQDYLKVIYDLSRDQKVASTNAIAERLGIAPASVTGMLQRLALYDPPLVDYRKHQGACLTPFGEKAALEVIRHHRLIETYLVKSLGYTWDEVHREADRLEHAISEDFETRIAEILGNPIRDPHGEFIPSSELAMPDDTSVALAELRPVQRARVSRVKAADPKFLRYVETLGLIPGAKVKVINHSPFDHNLTVEVNGNIAIVVGQSTTSQIFVEEVA